MFFAHESAENSRACLISRGEGIESNRLFEFGAQAHADKTSVETVHET